MEPSDFIAIADASGLIVPLTEWALRKGCAHAARYQSLGSQPRLAFRISARPLNDQHFTDKISRIAFGTVFDPRLLKLEIAEDAVTNRNTAVFRTIQTLGPMGAGLTIDGFGGSYAVLSHLKRLQIRKLKLDPSLMRQVDNGGCSNLAGDPTAWAQVVGADCRARR